MQSHSPGLSRCLSNVEREKCDDNEDGSDNCSLYGERTGIAEKADSNHCCSEKECRELSDADLGHDSLFVLYWFSSHNNYPDEQGILSTSQSLLVVERIVIAYRVKMTNRRRGGRRL